METGNDKFMKHKFIQYCTIVGLWLTLKRRHVGINLHLYLNNLYSKSVDKGKTAAGHFDAIFYAKLKYNVYLHLRIPATCGDSGCRQERSNDI